MAKPLPACVFPEGTITILRALIVCTSLTVYSAGADAVLMKPALDDLTYRALVTEVAGRIPAHAPEWTNHSASDPGFTLLELFRFLDDLELEILIGEYHTRSWWVGIDKDSERFLGELAYTLLDAGLRIALPPGEPVPKNWPMVYSVDLNQDFAELLSVARIPEPASLVLMGIALLGLRFARLRLR